jgi:hypothetical protein
MAVCSSDSWAYPRQHPNATGIGGNTIGQIGALVAGKADMPQQELGADMRHTG